MSNSLSNCPKSSSFWVSYPSYCWWYSFESLFFVAVTQHSKGWHEDSSLWTEYMVAIQHTRDSSLYLYSWVVRWNPMKESAPFLVVFLFFFFLCEVHGGYLELFGFPFFSLFFESCELTFLSQTEAQSWSWILITAPTLALARVPLLYFLLLPLSDLLSILSLSFHVLYFLCSPSSSSTRNSQYYFLSFLLLFSFVFVLCESIWRFFLSQISP